ncbi:MAG: C2H2-type zinc finger protein [Promethearchaeota archaeon]
MYLLRYNAQYPFKGPEKGETHPVVYEKQIIHDDRNYLSELINSTVNYVDNLELVWTYDFLDEKHYPSKFIPKKFLLRLKEILAREKQFAFISAYSIIDLEDTEIDDFIISKATEEKIRIIILIDKKNKDKVPDNLIELEALDNFDILYHPGTHAKFILTSKNWMMATANIDGTHGLRNSFEVGLIGRDIDIYNDFKEYFIELVAECSNSQDYVSEIRSMIFCSLCGKKFNTKNGLDQHLNGLAHKQRTIQCPHCSMKFKTEKSRDQHIGAKH